MSKDAELFREVLKQLAKGERIPFPTTKDEHIRDVIDEAVKEILKSEHAIEWFKYFFACLEAGTDDRIVSAILDTVETRVAKGAW